MTPKSEKLEDIMLPGLAGFVALTVIMTLFNVGFAQNCWAQQERAKQLSSAVPLSDMMSVFEGGLWGSEIGKWRTKVQVFVDPISHQMNRKTFTIWDPFPSRRLDFSWEPTVDWTTDNATIVSGRGKLTWRIKGLPTFDPSANVIIYRGEVFNGRPEGYGRYEDVSGLIYEGEWRDGNVSGVGHVIFANGDDFEGRFLAGRPEGVGRYIDASGVIYRGLYRNGRREGRATTTLSNGMVYESGWRNGIEDPMSRVFRLAQADEQISSPTTSASNDLRLSILVHAPDERVFGSDNTHSVQYPLAYAAANTPERLLIRPDNDRLMDMWKGKSEIQLTAEEEFPQFPFAEVQAYGVFSYPEQFVLPLTLTLEIENRATSAIQIRDAYLDVRKSVSDNQPAIQISAGQSGCDSVPRYVRSYSPTLRFENFGWGIARNAKIDYSFVSPGDANRPTAYDFSKRIGDIDKVGTINFEPDLAASRVNTKRLARMDSKDGVCVPTDIKVCLVKLGAEQTFGKLLDKIRFAGVEKGSLGDDDYPPNELDLITGIVGSLEYEWVDSSGTIQRRTSPFRSRLQLGRVSKKAGCEGGADSLRVIQQQPLDMKVDQSSYRIAIPFREMVPPGRVSRFAFSLKAPRASEHEFALVLLLADNREIKSRPVDLVYFRPRWYDH
jgi:hypothetical protein